MRREDEFTAFAEAGAIRLRQIAFLMCRDWHLAQDLTQTTLTKMYVAWPRINRRDLDPFGYARKVLLNSLLDHKRLRSSGEVAVDTVPDRIPDTVHESVSADTRLTLVDALAMLNPRDRAIVLLRYWEDHSIEATAEMVGVSISVVKTQSVRALAVLRARLGEDRANLFA